MHKNMNTQQVETKWWYCGPDSEKYGPYMSKDMLFWLQAGYFSNELLVRTENETNYRSLGEWTQLLGNHPFNTPVHSFDVTASQLASSRSQPHGPPMMMLPPGLPNQFPPQMPMRFPPFMPMQPLLHQMNGAQMGAQMHSQPPSEPIDAGSLSHTPDSENEARLTDQVPPQPPAWLVALGLAFQNHMRKTLHPSQMHQVQATMPPKRADAHTTTESVVMKNAECQTEPMKFELSKAHATRMLSELFGQIVVIN